ncbi:hypothetical protein GP475_10785 [Corynebacterium poyangense]|uniref:Uncharacterized protein n=1 Tax=Corynebacterium poyangense TaxID=2684405 RepID=A0A7H0SR85_9CORY|nr:hypothetical protein [Corynebacterium poyangense]MBZ8176490.1 hypothetical protein [Corynebacterium poyangense]QNQ91060.1 hypothetical protein GP475_10785 [Corynebacterium poyangense]
MALVPPVLQLLPNALSLVSGPFILDENQEIGGRYAGANPAQPPKKFGFRKGNLKHHRFTGSASIWQLQRNSWMPLLSFIAR